MISMEEYISKAIVGFNGNHFFEGCYNGKNYIAIINKNNAVLYSEESITPDSQAYRDWYRTEIRVDCLEDILEVKMYAIYKGNKYEVQTVSPRMKELELLARQGHEIEDKELGFVDNINERVTHIFINREEVENIYVEKRSVYKEIIEKHY